MHAGVDPSKILAPPQSPQGGQPTLGATLASLVSTADDKGEGMASLGSTAGDKDEGMCFCLCKVYAAKGEI